VEVSACLLLWAWALQWLALSSERTHCIIIIIREYTKDREKGQKKNTHILSIKSKKKEGGREAMIVPVIFWIYCLNRRK
jgi:hypothetical protein